MDKSVFDHNIADLSRDRPRYLAAGAPQFFGAGPANKPVSPEMVQWGVGLVLQSSPKATIDTLRASSETDLRPDMRAFSVPTLILHGDADEGAPIELDITFCSTLSCDDVRQAKVCGEVRKATQPQLA